MEKIKLVCFDLDETIIKQNSWLELGLKLGVTAEQDAHYYKECEAGQLTYDEWNYKLLELYVLHADANRAAITNILSKYTLVDDAKEIVEYLKGQGYKIVLIIKSIL